MLNFTTVLSKNLNLQCGTVTILGKCKWGYNCVNPLSECINFNILDKSNFCERLVMDVEFVACILFSKLQNIGNVIVVYSVAIQSNTKQTNKQQNYCKECNSCYSAKH